MTDFAEIHDELRAVARDLLSGADPLDGDGSAPPPADWATLAAMGWTGLEVPESVGGSGATFAEVAVVLEELGRATTVSPYLGTVVLGAAALGLAAPGAERDALLERVAAGAVRIATVLVDGAAEPDPIAPFVLRAAADGLRVDGRADLAPDVAGAEVLLLLASGTDGDPVLVALTPDAPGVTVSATPVVDATRSLGSVVVDGAVIPDDALLRFAADPAESVRRVLDRGALAVACDGVGLSRAMLDATVAYAGVREQFGRPIGSFQAVKHACADMLVHLSVSEELVRTAIDDVVRGDPRAGVSVSMAKAYVGDAAVAVAGKAMQLHGGVGYAWESGIHLYLKRAALDRSLFGSPIWHRRRLAQRLVERVGASGPPRPA
jgi:alkylation response protein AidB-like acyl-CoA dehydrogenase